MQSYKITDNQLILWEEKTSIVVRFIVFLLSLIFFLIPVVSIITAVAGKTQFHIGFVLGFLFSWLSGFYLLRVALWNTYGKEVLTFDKHQVSYYVDYGWFKDGNKTLKIYPRNYTIKRIGHETENKAVLVIHNGENKITCLTRMSVFELEKLKNILQRKDHTKLLSRL